MAAASGIWNQPVTAQTYAGSKATPMAASANAADDSSSAASSDSATIGANDFLTLLVTEMQNQDPTATTDPNEYINQLVQVNSLEQLISINQNLTTALGTSATSSDSGSPSGEKSDASSAGVNGKSATAQAAVAAKTAQPAAASATRAPGNLSVPSTNAAAVRVAQSLGGQYRTQ